MLSKHSALSRCKTYCTNNNLSSLRKANAPTHWTGYKFISRNSVTRTPRYEKQDKRINKIALLMAMHDEARPLIERLDLYESNKCSQLMKPFTVFKNENDSIHLVINGKCDIYQCDRIGTQWSTLCAYLTIHNLAPDVIINAGTCGGVIPKYCFEDPTDAEIEASDVNMAIGDVYIGEKVIYSDRRVPLPPWEIWAHGHFELIGANYLTQKIKSLKTAKYISSSNAFDYTKQDQVLFRTHNVFCKDMECAAIAEMAEQFGCEMIALKGVTDFVQHHNADDFVQNFIKTIHAVTDHTEQVINEIMGETLYDVAGHNSSKNFRVF